MPTATTKGPLVSEADNTARLTIWVRGRVQGVGFRWWTRSRALELGLAGKATNLEDGRVEIVVEGSEAACTALRDAVRDGDAPGRVTGVTQRWGSALGLQGFPNG